MSPGGCACCGYAAPWTRADSGPFVVDVRPRELKFAARQWHSRGRLCHTNARTEARGSAGGALTSAMVPFGVILDLDGTLADTLADLTAGLNHALSGVGLPPLPASRVRGYVGDGLANLIQRAVGPATDVSIDALIVRFREHYRAHCLDATRLYPGVDDMLTALAGAGCPLAVLSNKPDDFTRTMCAGLLGQWPIAAVAGASERLSKKPDPASALALCAAMDRRPAETVMVGDSPSDVETARRGGMLALGVTWGFRDRDSLAAAAPDGLVDDPAAAARWIVQRM